MCLAVYMQLLCRTVVKPRYVLLFWLFGNVVVLFNISSTGIYEQGTTVALLIGYTLLVVVQLYVAVHVTKDTKVDLVVGNGHN